MNPKVAIVILVVIVVVFIVALSTNLLPKSKFSKTDPPPDWVKTMQGGLVYHRPLDIRDVSAPPGCISNGSLKVQPGMSCLYTVKSSGIPARRVALSGASAHITIYNGDKKLSDADANPGDTIDIMSGGGKLLVVCSPTLVACVLTPPPS